MKLKNRFTGEVKEFDGKTDKRIWSVVEDAVHVHEFMKLHPFKEMPADYNVDGHLRREVITE